MIYSINIWAVLVCAAISIVVGSLWYGPLFGRKFLSLMGMKAPTKKQKEAMKSSMMKMYGLQLLASVVMFAVLAVFIANLGNGTALGGIHVALLMWLGMVVPLSLGRELWGGKRGLFWLGIGHMLVMLVIAGAVIGAWV